jgi:predicted metal-dependent HD superfamily phosphohydrolase
MFHCAAERGIELSREQIVAIWFHDVIYDVPAPEGKSNEKRSSDFAHNTLIEYPVNFFTSVEMVCRIIEDTEYPHLPTIDASAVVIDLDLSGLGLNYWENKKLIREEFAVYSDEEFNKGRLGWLKSMRERGKIFVSGLFDDLEDAARGNIEHEIRLLEEK